MFLILQGSLCTLRFFSNLGYFLVRFCTKLCSVKEETNLNQIFCLIKSSEIVVILLQTFYQLCDSHDITIFEEIAHFEKKMETSFMNSPWLGVK